MGDNKMKKGFSLLEVLVALLVIMIIFLSYMKFSIVSIRSNRYSEDLTTASILAHTKLVSLKNLPAESSQMSPEWHQDPENPILQGNVSFYRYWEVSDIPLGKQVMLYVAWYDHARSKPRDFASLSDLQESKCPVVTFHDIFLKE